MELSLKLLQEKLAAYNKMLEKILNYGVSILEVS